MHRMHIRDDVVSPVVNTPHVVFKPITLREKPIDDMNISSAMIVSTTVELATMARNISELSKILKTVIEAENTNNEKRQQGVM